MAVTATLSAAQLRSIEKAISRLGDSKSANVLVGKATRIAGKMFLLQPAKQATPKHTGQLRKATKLRAIKRKRNSAGVLVGYSDKEAVAKQAKTNKKLESEGKPKEKALPFYGAFIEYGYKVGSRRLGDARTKVKGRGILRKVAKIHGKRAQDHAAKLIAYAMEQLAKKK
jgi:hypothetical protein